MKELEQSSKQILVDSDDQPSVSQESGYELRSKDVEKVGTEDAPPPGLDPPALPAPATGAGDFPDGGRTAWLAVLGAWCCLFVSFGWITCIGDFQAYYERELLPTYSPSVVGWITSVETFIIFIGAPAFGQVFDSYGPRPLLLAGTFLHVFGLMMLSLCDKYYQIFLAQGVCSALGASAIFLASNNAVGTWFKRRRGLALGIVSSGSSVGGVVGTAAIPPLFNSIGFAWTVRSVAFVYLGLLIIALFTVKSRLRHQPSRFRPAELFAPLRDGYVVKLGAAAFFFFLGVFLPYNYLVVEAIDTGMSQVNAGHLLVVLSATSVIGRIIPGWAGDRLGRFNVTIAFTFLSALLVLAMWIPARNEATKIAFSALFGISSGTFVSMVPTLIAQICPDVRKIGVYMGATYLVISPAIIITQPVGGALINGDASGLSMYLNLKVLCGVAMFVGGVGFIIARAAYVALGRGEGRVSHALGVPFMLS